MLRNSLREELKDLVGLFYVWGRANGYQQGQEEFAFEFFLKASEEEIPLYLGDRTIFNGNGELAINSKRMFLEMARLG